MQVSLFDRLLGYVLALAIGSGLAWVLVLWWSS